MPGVEQAAVKEFDFAPSKLSSSNRHLVSLANTVFAKEEAAERSVKKAKKSAPPSVPDSSVEDSDEQSEDTDGSAEERLHWLHTMRRAAAIHIEANKIGVPLCYLAAGTQLKSPYARGEGLEGMADTSRAMCVKCMARVSSASAKAINKIRGE